QEGPAPQLIMIGSALPGDGKTFTGINLAFSMAREKDHSVLLVDGDVAKPHVSKLFGVDREPGLLDVLNNPGLDVRSVILPTDIPGLSLLPAGTPSETATELLASDRMAQVVDQLAQLDPGGIVLFDSLPILLTSESRVLTTLMGQIVLVVKAGTTPQQAVSDALEAIGADKKIWLVLNQAELSGPLGYYYGYRYGYAQPESGAQPAADEGKQAAGF
ncbi:MAG: CpsD/CapB family tyrosine-protein kinase, partial [Steroidobacter sp.]